MKTKLGATILTIKILALLAIAAAAISCTSTMSANTKADPLGNQPLADYSDCLMNTHTEIHEATTDIHGRQAINWHGSKHNSGAHPTVVGWHLVQDHCRRIAPTRPAELSDQQCMVSNAHYLQQRHQRHRLWDKAENALTVVFIIETCQPNQ